MPGSAAGRWTNGQGGGGSVGMLGSGFPQRALTVARVRGRVVGDWGKEAVMVAKWAHTAAGAG
jgi:hypothetical protein